MHVHAVDSLGDIESSAPERTGGADHDLAGGEGDDADGNGDEANCTPL